MKTSDEEAFWSTTDSNRIAGGEALNVQEDFHHTCSPTTVDRYFKQKMSAHGKVAYVVFSGHDVGIFYNWYMFISYCEILWLSFCLRTVASAAISGLANTRKVYKGYSSYEGAHSAWDGFASTGRLPHDVAATLGSRPYPVPPIPSSPRVFAPPHTPQRSHTYDHHAVSPHSSTPTPLTPCSAHGVPTTTGPLSSHISVVPRSLPTTPMSTQSRNTATLTIAREEALRADQEDFWVVFTGIAPGVYQGR